MRFLAVIAVLVFALPAAVRAQPLIVPLTGHRARPIEAETLFHTLFSDFFSESDDTTYVQTGDIPAMWLRDSAAQSIPYVRFANAYPILAVRLNGVIQREAREIAIDPYANAFRADYGIWEAKWEPDSLAWPMLLARTFWRTTRERMLFTAGLHTAMRTAVDTWVCEQHHATCRRYAWRGPVPTSRAYDSGTGMVWGAFRPSDDPVRYRFNIPQQAIVVAALRAIAGLAVEGYGDRALAERARAVAQQIEGGIDRYGRVPSAGHGGDAYVYETDGLGHDLYADDANIPDLLSLPYIGWCSAYDPAYVRTRDRALSYANPWYYAGRYGAGLGSPHTPTHFVWPLGIIDRALTSTSATETAEAVTTLAETDSRDGLIHESFYDNGYWLFTRAEFGWGNALYAELIFRSVAGFPGAPYAAGASTTEPFETVSATPMLTQPLASLRDAALIYGALGDLLREADGRDVIRRVQVELRK